jgi:hypothetical protein
VLTTDASADRLLNGMVFCRIKSWLTGRRLVSLPFSDHCEPLVDDRNHHEALLDHVAFERSTGRWKFVELRSGETVHEAFGQSARFLLHQLDLRPDLDKLASSFHKNHTWRKVKRSEREGLEYEEGRSEHLLHAFYRLLIQTRRRHQLPPQPIVWFRNVLRCVGSDAVVRVASKNGVPIAAMLTLRHREAMVYKYGASDSQFHALGGMHFLFWKVIQNARASGCVTLDFGRSDLDNEGLINFKDRWGTTRSELTYFRYPKPSRVETGERSTGVVTRQVLSVAPNRLLIAAGSRLYRHFG